MRSIFFALTLAAAAFAAGWFLRPLSLDQPSERAGQKGASQRIGNARGAPDGMGAALASANRPGGPETQSLEQVTDMIRTLLREKDAMKSSAALRSLVANASPEDVPTLVKAYNICMNDGWQTRELGLLVTMMEGKIMGKAGMDGLPQEPNGMPGYVMKNRMRGWASDDPAACKEWLESLESGRTRNDLTAEWLNGMKDAAPEKLQALLPKLKPEQQAGIIGRIVDDEVKMHGLSGMADWFRTTGASLPEATKDRAFTFTIDAFTQHQTAEGLQQAVEFLKQISDPAEQRFATGLQQMVWRSARNSPRETLDLLNDYLPQNQFLAETRGKFISQFVKVASNNTVNTIGDWLNEHRESPIYNDVARQFLTHVQSIDPDGAKAWAKSITDQAVRDEMLSLLQKSEQ